MDKNELRQKLVREYALGMWTFMEEKVLPEMPEVYVSFLEGMPSFGMAKAYPLSVIQDAKDKVPTSEIAMSFLKAMEVLK